MVRCQFPILRSILILDLLADFLDFSKGVANSILLCKAKYLLILNVAIDLIPTLFISKPRSMFLLTV